ncbi:hypothetical protein D7S86_13890 [Pararobbsia silviterrae]|uniref:SMP-30/Gluconolactonase/LRE-like region domain-containing protein n=1 Tax=Pararobbsia silviterrae TaxID=1792498 RepID=A0A494XVX8_9BURK|nr:hypothetical protein D7S86_13890 [Pararobbsia silviterrae]
MTAAITSIAVQCSVPQIDQFSLPFDAAGIVVDSADNLFITAGSTVGLYEKAAGATGLLSVATGVSAPAGLGIDSGNNLYISELDNGNVYELSSGVTTQLAPTTALHADNITADAAGDVFVVGYGYNTVYKIAAGSSSASLVTEAIADPVDVTVDLSGNLFVVSVSGTLYEIPVGTSTPVVFPPTAHLQISEAVVGGDGTIYVAAGLTDNNITIYKIPPGSSNPTLVSLGTASLGFPGGMAIDSSGHLFITDSQATNLIEVVSP